MLRYNNTPTNTHTSTHRHTQVFLYDNTARVAQNVHQLVTIVDFSHAFVKLANLIGLFMRSVRQGSILVGPFFLKSPSSPFMTEFLFL